MGDESWALWLLVGAWLLARYDRSVAPDMQQKGADLYETLHPEQKGHQDDLPGKQMTRAQLVSLARAAGFPDPPLAAAIAMAESGGVPNALANTDREYSVGLWQINLRVHRKYSRQDMADPAKNAAAAYAISKGGTNWKPWSAYKSGRYRDYLDSMRRADPGAPKAPGMTRYSRGASIPLVPGSKYRLYIQLEGLEKAYATADDVAQRLQQEAGPIDSLQVVSRGEGRFEAIGIYAGAARDVVLPQSIVEAWRS